MKRSSDLLAALAATLGASGVALAALAAHAGGSQLATLAAYLLLAHAAGLLGVAATGRGASERRSRRLMMCGAALAAGAILFCADVATLGFRGHGLFRFAAPIGGSLMILSWMALALVFVAKE